MCHFTDFVEASLAGDSAKSILEKKENKQLSDRPGPNSCGGHFGCLSTSSQKYLFQGFPWWSSG